MGNIHITVVIGTGRDGRYSEVVATYIYEKLEALAGVTSELFDVRDLGYSVTLPPWGAGGTETTPSAWQEAVHRSHGIVLVVPEYNRGYPGELKLLLDTLYDEYEGKPVALCGVSNGPWGGARVLEHIKPVLFELGLRMVRKHLYVTNVEDLFAQDGTITDPAFDERVKAFAGTIVEAAHNTRP